MNMETAFWWFVMFFMLTTALMVVAFADEQDHKPVLVLTYVMPGRAPDVRQVFKEDSIEACWDDAKAFVARGVPKAVEEATAVMAACMEQAKKEDDL